MINRDKNDSGYTCVKGSFGHSYLSMFEGLVDKPKE